MGAMAAVCAFQAATPSTVPSSMPRPPQPADMVESAAHAWATSLLFWGSLLISATLYAGVALSPKVLAWSELKREYFENQVRLVTLERQVKYLGRVVDALENEPEFTAQLARIDFDAARPGDERITVDSPLSLDSRDLQPVTVAAPSHLSLAVPLLKHLTERGELRRALLTAAAALTVFAFTFFPETSGHSEEEVARSAPRPRGWGEWMRRRYRSTAT